MTMLLMDFVNQLTSNPVFFITIVLTLGVLLVNGWTDAPNAIATCVASRSLPVRQAVLMAASFDFLGVFVMTLINSSVAQTIYKMVDFQGDLDASLAAMCAAMVAVIVWASMAARLGIPTSEGHALIAGISGAAIALQNGLSGINGDEWVKVIYGLFLSVLVGFTAGWILAKTAQNLFRQVDRRWAGPFFIKAQVMASAGMAFMHGAQDGQKLIAVVILGIMLVNRVDSAVRGHSQVDLVVADVLAIVDVEDLGFGYAGKPFGQGQVILLGDRLPERADFGRGLSAGVVQRLAVRSAGRRDRVGDRGRNQTAVEVDGR